jgi:hypothetical protein
MWEAKPLQHEPAYGGHSWLILNFDSLKMRLFTTVENHSVYGES